MLSVLVGCGAADEAPVCAPWSAPETWPSGAVPALGDCVEIPPHTCVVFDVAEASLSALAIRGTLSFADQDAVLRVDQLVVEGTLEIGTEARPFLHQATLELTSRYTTLVPGSLDDAAKGDGVDWVWAASCPTGAWRLAPESGPASLVVRGTATLDLHGRPHGDAWRSLASTAAVGDTHLALQGQGPWPSGERVIVTSSDFDPGQAEVGTLVFEDQLAEALLHDHFAGVVGAAGGALGVETRAEVARLDRNVRVVAVDPLTVPISAME